MGFTNFSCKNSKESDEMLAKGDIHFAQSDYDGAIDSYSQAIDLNSRQAMAFYNRGLAYIQKGELEKAGLDFQETMSLDRKFAYAAFMLARVYTDLGEYEVADRLFKEWETNLDTSAAFHNFYGQNFIYRNKFSEGEEHFKKALELNPDHVETLTNLAYSKTVNHYYEEAESLLEKALKISPNFVFALNNRAVLYGIERNFVKAIDLLKDIKEENNPFVYNNLALYYLENNQLEEAEANIIKAKQIDEDNPYLLRNEAVLKLKKGEPGNALKQLLEIEEHSPGVDHIYYYIGESYRALKDENNACENYKKAIGFRDTWAENKCK